MTIEEIKELLKIFNESGVGELELQRGKDMLRIRRAVEPAAGPVHAAPAIPPAAAVVAAFQFVAERGEAVDEGEDHPRRRIRSQACLSSCKLLRLGAFRFGPVWRSLSERLWRSRLFTSSLRKRFKSAAMRG